MESRHTAQGARDTCLKVLQRRLLECKRQKLKAQNTGQEKIVRLKRLQIKLLKDAVIKAKTGRKVDMHALPDPCKNTFTVFQETRNSPDDNRRVISSESQDSESALSSKRKSNYCILCESLVKKFSEHIEKNHPESDVGQSLRNVSGTGPTRRRLKTKITDAVRKKWNAVYNRKLMDPTKNVHNVCDSSQQICVKRRNNLDDVPNVECLHCEGLYRRDKLYSHLRFCEKYNKNRMRPRSTKKALKKHSKSLIPDVTSVSDAFKKEILNNKKVDPVLSIAVGDPLLMRFGSDFHQSRRSESDRDYVMRVIRDLTKMYMIMKEKESTLESFKEILSPVHFEGVCDAVLEMGKYDQATGEVRVPSVAYRLSQPLKEIASLAKAELLESIWKNDGGVDRREVTMIDDFLHMMNERWKNKVGRMCTKTQKKRRVNRTDKMALEDDIIKVAGYIEVSYAKLLQKLEKEKNKNDIYDTLVHMLVVHAMLLVRRRPIDFKHATLQNYTNIDRHDELLEMSKGFDLTPEMLDDCKRFHIFYVPGKNLQIVPIVFTPSMKKVCDELIKFRNAVGIENDKLFSLSQGGSIEPTESIRLIKMKVRGLRRPDDLTGNGLRHQAATFSRLNSDHPQYQDYLASALGHTLAVHKKYYELPMGILQKIIVCPTLHRIMTREEQKRSRTKRPNPSNGLGSAKVSSVRKVAAEVMVPHDEASDDSMDSDRHTPYQPTTSDATEDNTESSGDELEIAKQSRNVREKRPRIDSDESENETAQAREPTRVIELPDQTVSTESTGERFDGIGNVEGDRHPVSEHEPSDFCIGDGQSEDAVNSADGVSNDATAPESNSVVTAFESTCQSPDSSSSSYSSGLSFAHDEVGGDDNSSICNTKITRRKWTKVEQELVLGKFSKHILKKRIPTRGEVAEFVKLHPELQKSRTLDQVVLFVRNYAVRQKKNVTPTVKAFLKRRKRKI